MKTAVVYCSQTGHTEKYARWLADDLKCPVYPIASGRGSLQNGGPDE